MTIATQTVADPPAILCGSCDHNWHEGRCQRWGCRCDRGVPPQARQETAVTSVKPLAGLCVVVSMHDDRRLEVAHMLVDMGWEVVTARDYDEAINVLGTVTPQLVVVDALGHRRPGTSLTEFLVWLGHKHKDAGFGVVYLRTPGIRRGRIGALGPMVRKPVNPAHLAIAVDSVLPKVVEGALVRLDLRSGEVLGPAGSERLTYLESRLLAYLTEHHGETLTSDKLLTDVWGYGTSVGASTLVRAHVSNLRGKLCRVGLPRESIRTQRLKGYRCDLVIPVVG